MERRTLLSALGSGIAAALAGCLGAGPGGTDTRTPGNDTPSPTEGTPSPGPTDPPTETPEPTDPPTETPGAGPEVSFSVGDRSCGSGENSATVSFDGDTVEIDGVIGGRDTCDTAVLDGVRMSDDVLTVRVAVGREESDGTTACAQCLTDIEYGATARFDGDLPATVEVVHESADGITTVAREER